MGIRDEIVARKVESNNVLVDAKKGVAKKPFAYCIRGDWQSTITGISEFFAEKGVFCSSKGGIGKNWVNENVPSAETRRAVKTKNGCINLGGATMQAIDPIKAEKMAYGEEKPMSLQMQNAPASYAR